MYKYVHIMQGVSCRVNVESLSENIEPTVSLPENPLDTFSLLFTPTIMEHIVHETNWYAEQCLADSDKDWTTNIRG